MLKLALFLLTFASSLFLTAQNMPVSGGGDADSAAGNISYSIGQIAFVPILGDELALTPGNQQPAEISFIPSVGTSIEKGGFKLFPNPSRDHIMIASENINGEVNLVIRNALGQVVFRDLLTANRHQLNIRQLAAGSYFVYIISNQAQFTTLKFIKL